MPDEEKKPLPPRTKPRRKPGKPDQGAGRKSGGGKHAKDNQKNGNKKPGT